MERSREPQELNLSNDAILAAIAEADREYTVLFDFQERRVRRAKEKKAMQISHQQARVDDLNVKPAQRQQNAEYRQAQVNEMMQCHEREAMYEEEMECRRGIWLTLIEQENQQITWERALKAQECKKGLIARGLAYDLRGHDAARIVGLARRFLDDPAVVGQALMELSLALMLLPNTKSSGGSNLNRSGGPPFQQCEAARREGVAALVVEAMARYPHVAFVQEQATNAIYRLCSWSPCGQELLQRGAFQALLRAFHQATGPMATPLRLSIARALDALYTSTYNTYHNYGTSTNNAGQQGVSTGGGGGGGGGGDDDPCRRPVQEEEEEEAMRALCDFLVSQPGKAQVAEACCQALITLTANRPHHLSWLLLPPIAMTTAMPSPSSAASATTTTSSTEPPSIMLRPRLGFLPIVQRLLREYRSFDSRRPRADNAAVIRECYRLLTAVTEGGEDSLVKEVFMFTSSPTRGSPSPSTSLVEDLKAAHEGHARDPFCQLAHAQLWESFCSRRAHLLMAALSMHHDKEAVVTSLAASFTASLRTHLRIHVIQYKYLSALVHLFAIKPAATAQGLLRAEGGSSNGNQNSTSTSTSGGGEGEGSASLTLERCFSEGAADVVLLNALLRATLLFTQDFRFLSAMTRDDSSLPQVIHKSLGLHPQMADTQLIGTKLLAQLKLTSTSQD